METPRNHRLTNSRYNLHSPKHDILALMAHYKPHASVSHPQEEFSKEGEMSQSSPSATAANGTGTTFAAANPCPEHQSSIHYGLPTLNQFMPDH